MGTYAMSFPMGIYTIWLYKPKPSQSKQHALRHDAPSVIIPKMQKKLKKRNVVAYAVNTTRSYTTHHHIQATHTHAHTHARTHARARTHTHTIEAKQTTGPQTGKHWSLNESWQAAQTARKQSVLVVKSLMTHDLCMLPVTEWVHTQIHARARARAHTHTPKHPNTPTPSSISGAHHLYKTVNDPPVPIPMYIEGM